VNLQPFFVFRGVDVTEVEVRVGQCCDPIAAGSGTPFRSHSASVSVNAPFITTSPIQVLVAEN
jgi:hypothetical protein